MRSFSLRAVLLPVSLLLFVAIALSFSGSAKAENLIKNPGDHNEYKFELEPQLVLRTGSPGWGGYACNDPYDDPPGRRGCNYYGGAGGWTGVGPGVRVNIPFMHNGPVTQINNNIGISFGGSLTFHGNAGYNATVLNLPVAFQWNFYFTEVVSVLGEMGLNTPIAFWAGGSSFNVEPLIQAGGRFQWGKVGLIVRLGWPLLSVGANFQF